MLAVPLEKCSSLFHRTNDEASNVNCRSFDVNSLTLSRQQRFFLSVAFMKYFCMLFLSTCMPNLWQIIPFQHVRHDILKTCSPTFPININLFYALVKQRTLPKSSSTRIVPSGTAAWMWVVYQCPFTEQHHPNCFPFKLIY